MAYFLGRLLAPRRTFPADITDTEKRLMQEHVVYWSEFIEKGKVLALGPVDDPKGMWGLGLFDVADEAEIRALTSNDPVIKAGLGFVYDILPMPRLTMHK